MSVRTSTSAPPSRRSWTRSSCPPAAARCSSFQPPDAMDFRPLPPSVSPETSMAFERPAAGDVSEDAEFTAVFWQARQKHSRKSAGRRVSAPPRTPFRARGRAEAGCSDPITPATIRGIRSGWNRDGAAVGITRSTPRDLPDSQACIRGVRSPAYDRLPGLRSDGTNSRP